MPGFLLVNPAEEHGEYFTLHFQILIFNKKLYLSFWKSAKFKVTLNKEKINAMQTITISIPEALSERYVNSSLQTLMLNNFVVAEYQKGNLSIRDSAEILKLSYSQFIDMLGSYHLPFINANKQEIQSNYDKFRSFILSKP